MSDTDCRISFILSKLFIPGSETDKCIFDISYNGENFRVKYPMIDPLTITLKNVFSKDRSILHIVAMVQEGQKYRKLAKGDINVYKKYLFNDKLEIEKFIHLELCKPQIDRNSFGSNILNAMSGMGKVSFKAMFLDPELNDSKTEKKESMNLFTKGNNTSKITQILRSNIKNYLLNREKLINNKTERFKSLMNKETDLLYNIQKDPKNKSKKNKEDDSFDEDIPLEEKPYNDGLSDISVSILEGLEDDCVKIEEVSSEMNDFIKKIKILFDEKFEQMLPSNNEELKIFVNKITKQIQLIAENYITNIEQLHELNNKIKQQAKIYYEKYKENKKVFKKERKELKKKNQLLENEINSNIEENKQIKGKFDDFRVELTYFKSLIGIKEEHHKVDDDILTMVDILNSVKTEIDITSGLSENQIYALNEVMNKYKDKLDENQLSTSIIIDKIEHIVNDLYENGKIKTIEIKQNTEIEYIFNNLKCVLSLQKDNLIVEGENILLEDWLLNNFGVKKSRTDMVKVNTKVN